MRSLTPDELPGETTKRIRKTLEHDERCGAGQMCRGKQRRERASDSAAIRCPLEAREITERTTQSTHPTRMDRQRRCVNGTCPASWI